MYGLRLRKPPFLTQCRRWDNASDTDHHHHHSRRQSLQRNDWQAACCWWLRQTNFTYIKPMMILWL